MILDQWEALGLKSMPNTGDNGVHASASPSDALAERANWLKQDISQDAYGRGLVSHHEHAYINICLFFVLSSLDTLYFLP
jgi:hypothetical protein